MTSGVTCVAQSRSGFETALITDLDNTIYNWVDYFAPCFRSMVHVIHDETGVEESAITEQFREVYKRYGSVEYAFSVQQLALCSSMSEECISKLVKRAKGAFARVREKRLRLYPGVKRTLETIQKHGIAVVGVTNAPIALAVIRLKELRIDHLFNGLAGWEGFRLPDSLHFASGGEWEGWKSRIQRTWSLEHSVLKPNPRAYLIILEDLHIPASSAYVVGDSLSKDVYPAIEIGASGILARYGTHWDRKNFETLLAITPWGKDRIRKTYSDTWVGECREINAFEDVLHLLPVQQHLSLGLVHEERKPKVFPDLRSDEKGETKVVEALEHVPVQQCFDLVMP